MHDVSTIITDPGEIYNLAHIDRSISNVTIMNEMLNKSMSTIRHHYKETFMLSAGLAALVRIFII